MQNQKQMKNKDKIYLKEKIKTISELNDKISSKKMDIFDSYLIYNLKQYFYNLGQKDAYEDILFRNFYE